MAFSVESRVPFTDYRIVEFAFSPAMRNLKLKDGWAKWGLRKAVQGLTYDDIIWRRDKMGFGTPEAQMVQKLLQHRGVKTEGPVCEWVEPGKSDAILAKAAAGAANRDEVLQAFRILCFDSWLKTFAS